MIDLEWIRTFRTVYIKGSLTKAAEELSITQPAVSQHIAALEVYTGNKLFIRKSKGVEPSDYARTFNNMIANSLDELLEVEKSLLNDTLKQTPFLNVGISRHLYPSIVKDKIHELDPIVHLIFDSTDNLVKDTEEGNLHYAIVPGTVNYFDIICHELFEQRLILVHTPDIELKLFEKLFETDRKESEKWLSSQKWYSHRSVTPFIKQFWMDVFNKKRPEIVPYRVIPNEMEVLGQLARGSGLALCFDNNAKSFIKNGTLVSSKVSSSISRNVVLIANRKKTEEEITKNFISLLAAER